MRAKEEAEAKANVQANASQQPVSNPNPTAVPIPGASEENVIVAEFSRQTGMNLTYSRQCLQEFGWQFETALASFRTMHASGSIPQVAFAPD